MNSRDDRAGFLRGIYSGVSFFIHTPLLTVQLELHETNAVTLLAAGHGIRLCGLASRTGDSD